MLTQQASKSKVKTIGKVATATHQNVGDEKSKASSKKCFRDPFRVITTLTLEEPEDALHILQNQSINTRTGGSVERMHRSSDYDEQCSLEYWTSRGMDF